MNVYDCLLDALQQTYNCWGRKDRAYTKRYKENHVKDTVIRLKTSLDTLNSFTVLPKHLYVRVSRNNDIWLLNTETGILYSEQYDAYESLRQILVERGIVCIYTVEQYNFEMEIQEQLSYNLFYMCDYHFVPSLTPDYSHIDIDTILFQPTTNCTLIEDDLPF